MKIVLSEAEAPVVDALGSEFEGIENREVDGGHVFFAATEPGFGLLGRRHC
jgi:hypothetical protein